MLLSYSFQLSILFNYIDQAGRDCPKYATLLKQGVLIAAFIMNEQAFDDRQNSPIVAKFLEISEHAIALELAKRYQVCCFLNMSLKNYMQHSYDWNKRLEKNI